LPKEKDVIAFLQTQSTISNQAVNQTSDADKIRAQLEKMKQRKQNLKPRMH